MRSPNPGRPAARFSAVGLPKPGRKRPVRLKEAELEQAKTCDIILATYKMMSEGSDIPELDTLFLATPRADIEQIVGRIQRHHDDKKSLLVVDPVFINQSYCVAMGRKRIPHYKNLGFSPQQRNSK